MTDKQESLINRYRPRSFKSVIGQDHVVGSLRGLIKRNDAHSFLFSGPSGTGKTTLARICAKLIGCDPAEIQEVDAATESGVDDVRAITSTLHYRPWGVSQSKAVIIDECHALSTNAWKALLKVTEEPPEHVYWFLCTTEPGKVPKTIKTRCATYELRDVSRDEIRSLLERIREAEKWQTPDKVLGICVNEARGSVRQAISNLAICAEAKSTEEASDLLQSAEERREVIDLCRLLLRGAPWKEFAKLLAELKDTNPESIRMVVLAYMSSVLLGTKSDKDAQRIMAVLEAFSKPFNSNEKIAPVALAIGNLVLA